MHGFSEILTLHGSTNTHPGIKNCKGFIHSSEKNDTALYLDISYKLYHAILVQLWIGILNWSSWIRSDNTTSNWTLDIPKIFFWSEIILISSVSRKSTKCIWVELGFWVELSTIQNFSGLCGMRPTFQFSKSKKKQWKIVPIHPPNQRVSLAKMITLNPMSISVYWTEKVGLFVILIMSVTIIDYNE